MDNFFIREMVSKDYDQAYRLWAITKGVGLSQADSPDSISSFLDRNKGLSFICQTGDGKIIGTALCGHDGRRGFIYHLAVAEGYRGKGIGRELVDRCIEKLRSCGIDKCHIFVMKENIEGQEFWENTGWTRRDDLCVFSKII